MENAYDTEDSFGALLVCNFKWAVLAAWIIFVIDPEDVSFMRMVQEFRRRPTQQALEVQKSVISLDYN